ncbi:MAG: SdrD B-like domain-containing protein [Saprospiraceae bacterium]
MAVVWQAMPISLLPRQPEDGIMMEAEYFGSTPGGSGVQVHEMGHYLGLYHTFQGGCTNNDCLADGDRVCDTPPDQSTAPVPCGGTVNSCSTDINSGFSTDQNDLYEDYMDYGDFNCWSVFTQGQADRMAFHIENVRSSLLESQGCQDPCTSALTASFSTSTDQLAVGGAVNFTNNSTNTTSASWEIDGTPFASTTDASFTFNQEGVFEICLIVGNADPNCSDKFCEEITVNCLVQAEFSTDIFYPNPGETVTYTNSSLNASQFDWKINGTSVATSQNLTWAFATDGIYDVCLTASDGLCEREFCLPVFVAMIGDSSGCDTTFLKTYGTLQDDEISRAIIAVPASLGGGFLIGGGKRDSAMITLLDPVGDIVWTRSFDATPDAEDFIWDIKFDSDNNVIGVGNTKNEPLGNVECFAFKYNMVTNTMLWINELDLNDPARESYRSILEKSPGGNYIVVGETDLLLGGTGCDAILIELNRNTGANVWQRNMHFGSCETYLNIISANNGFYTVGRNNFNGGGQAGFRPAISKFDTNGNQLWTRWYLQGPNPTARLYGFDLTEDNGLIVVGYGDEDGISTAQVELLLFKTDYDGQLQWTMKYDIPGSTNEIGVRILNLPDGYLCLGMHSATDRNVFVFKTDKQGNLQWSKSYGSNNGRNEEAWDMLWQNGQIYFTGNSSAPNGGISEDVFLANIAADGSTTAQDSCNLFSNLEMTQSPWQNPYDEQHDLTDLGLNWFQFLNTAQMGETAVQTTTECFIPCLDSCDLVPEAFVNQVSASCDGQGLLIVLEICNTGNFDLPAGTPVTFYDSDPTAGAASTVATIPLLEAVGDMDCKIFNLAIPGLPNETYFVVVNDDGLTPTPFDLATFDGPQDECDYTNNIGSFQYDYTPPVLNLGPDVSMCQFGVVDLDAGPGFATYTWQDGSSEQTLTAFNPGTYSVTVVDECGGEQMDQITISIDSTTVLDLGPDIEICEGSSYTFDVQGFEMYQWSPADYLSCTDCSNPTTTPLAGITYTLVATNADGCISVDSVEVQLLPGFAETDSLEICQGDSVIVFGNTIDTAGVFSETFTSTGGCDSTQTIVVTILPAIEFIADVIICRGDTVDVFGIPVFESGQFSQTFTSQNGCDSIATISVGVLENVLTEETRELCFGETTDIFGTPTSTSGVYEMTFTGSNSCDSTHVIVLTVNDEIFLDFQKTDVTCFGGMDGSITATASGGLSVFTYVWENGSIGPIRDNLVAGTYSCTVTDASGCTVEASVDISQPTAVSISATGVDVTCTTLGTATADASGGTGTLTYLWSNGDTTPAVSGLVAGTYSVTATDANGCTGETTVVIGGALGPNVDIEIVQAISENDPNSGELTVDVSGGTSPFTYNWSNGETTTSIDSLPSGAYLVTVTDANGCTAVDSTYLFLAACTGGKIWNDLDRDGCQDGGELGFANVTLNLTGTDIFGNAVTATTTSAINGEYIFENLAPGNYQVHITVPSGYTLTTANNCTDDFTDSDFGANGNSYVIVLTEGHCCLIVDGGIYESCLNVSHPGTICCDQVLCGPGNDPAPLTATPATGANQVQYMWIYSHAQSPASIGNPTWYPVLDAFGNPVMTATYDPGPLSETTYFARCTRAVGCTNWLETNVVEIKVEDDAVALIDEPGAICVGNPITFTAAPNGPNAKYHWNFGPYATPSQSTAQSPTVVWSQPGYISISLEVTDNGCVSKDVQLIAVSDNPVYCGTALSGSNSPNNQMAASPSLQVEGRFDIYPNPMGDVLNVRWDSSIESDVELALSSIAGQVLITKSASQQDRLHALNVADLPSGLYLLKAKTMDGEVSVFRVVKR